MKKLAIVTKGIAKENPALVSLLGLCPVLAVSANVSHALGMGIATVFVLVGSSTVISSIRNIIPVKVRIPCFIVVIAGFVTIIMMFMQAYAYSLYLALGIFLPLITVNCVIFSRAEVFARNNTIGDSILDAIGYGTGYMLALLAISTIREVVGKGSWLGVPLPVLRDFNIPLFSFAPGGFIALALILAIVNKVSKGTAIKKTETACAGCPSASRCGKGDAE